MVLSLSPLFGGNASEASAASTHQVQKGDTYYKIATQYGVSVLDLMRVNSGNKTSVIYPGQKMALPNSFITETEKDLIARLVQAEAEAEPYAGKVAVASVVLNRMASPDFPNTVREIIYQKSNGYFAFTPVQNGAINKPASALAKKAVNEALAFRGQGKGSLFFYNPKTAKSPWIFSRETTITIGNHKFAK